MDKWKVGLTGLLMSLYNAPVEGGQPYLIQNHPFSSPGQQQYKTVPQTLFLESVHRLDDIARAGWPTVIYYIPKDRNVVQVYMRGTPRSQGPYTTPRFSHQPLMPYLGGFDYQFLGTALDKTTSSMRPPVPRNARIPLVTPSHK